MGRVLKKTGLFGLGKPKELWYCDSCNVECLNKYYKEPHMYCRSCANSIDPLVVHGWSSDEILNEYQKHEFFTDTSTNMEIYIDHCLECLSVVVVEHNRTDYQRRYYTLSLIHISSPRDRQKSRMPSSA